MSRGASVRGQLAKAPAAVATSPTGNAAWFHEAPTRPNQVGTLPAEASLSTSGTVSVDTKVGAEAMCDAVSDRLSDPGRWFQSISPPPPPPPLPQPPMEIPPEQMRRRRMGSTLVTLFMALSLLILFAATIVRVRAAIGAEKSRAIASAPAPSVTKPQIGGVHTGSTEARKEVLR